MNVLIIEDNEGDFLLVQEYLLEGIPEAVITHVEFLSEALKAIVKNNFDVILLDLSLPDSKGENSISQLKLLAHQPPIIVLTGSIDKQTGINSLRLGVQDYLVKDEINETILQKSISYSIERKNNQQQLEQNEKRFRALIENSTDGLAELNSDGEITEMSQSALNILGYPTKVALSFATLDFVHPDDLKKVLLIFNLIVSEHNKVKSTQFRVKRANGNYIWLEANFHNLLHEPAVNAVVLNFRDITNRIQNEQDRKALIDELTASNTDLKQYTFLASHNLRAPLTNLISIINIMDWELIKDENCLVLLQAFKESTFKLNDTLNDMIEVVLVKKMDNIALKEIAFEDIYQKAIKTLQPQLLQSGAMLQTDFAAVPHVYFDAIYLENVFTHLISNAVKYAATDRILQLNITSYFKEGEIQLVFADNGMGMDMQVVKDKIFGLYQRFHNNEDSKGLDLYMVRSQMNALGGTISVHSTLNKGTTFTLLFKKAVI
jgi:PAS domain S-box-containing protein